MPTRLQAALQRTHCSQMLFPVDMIWPFLIGMNTPAGAFTPAEPGMLNQPRNTSILAFGPTTGGLALDALCPNIHGVACGFLCNDDRRAGMPPPVHRFPVY